MPEEGESLDNIAVKELCQTFIKKHKDAEYYEQISKFAERKIKQVDFAIAQEKKLKKLTKKK